MADEHLNNSPEIWKAVPGFPGYEASTHGRIRSFWRKVGRGRSDQGALGGTKQVLDGNPQRILRPRIRPAGYKDVNLRRDGENCHSSVHKLVLITFIGPRPPGMEACHNDGKPSNNFLSNLRWDTPKNNQFDSLKHGTKGSAKLNSEKVIKIRKMASQGYTYAELMNLFLVTRSTISKIVLHQTWPHIM